MLPAAVLAQDVAQDVAQLARAYSDSPSTTTRAALSRFAATHSGKPAALALLAIGDPPSLRAARPALPELDDYIALLLANADLVASDFEAAGRDAESGLRRPSSPVEARLANAAAQAYSKLNQPADAVRILRAHYAALPQPDGDAALAAAFTAAGDPKSAAPYWTRIWLDFPAGTQAKDAEAALGSVSATPQALLSRASKLLDARDFVRARQEFAAIAAGPPSPERDLAAVRLGAADYRARKNAEALAYLATLQVPTPEADAERLYWLVAAASRLDRLDTIEESLASLARQYGQSSWRREALIVAGGEYFALNQPENYERVYWSCYQDFPSSPRAAYCHWRVAFSAYIHRRPDAADLLKAHVSLFPRSGSTPAALYFLARLTDSPDPYQQILRQFPNDYYAVLARGRLQLEAAPATFALRSGIFQPAPAARFRFERARLLETAALHDLAITELRFGGEHAEHPEAIGLELARLCSARDEFARGIRFLKRYASGYVYTPLTDAPREFWLLAYPLPYLEPLENYSEQQGLDPFMVAALVRQESEFDPQVISRAGAYGLTQVMPSTGRELSRSLGIRGFRTGMLTDPAVNLRLGTVYLKRLLTQLDGQWELALAAYNAGKTRAIAWQSRSEFREPAEYIESIPFPETHNYVKVVLRNADLYRRLYSKN